MSSQPLTNNAAASTKGTVYHLYVTVAKCFEMDLGQAVFVEHFGDVTISGTEQTETKHYSDSLTDSHANFWKTLSNWMQAGFDDTKYSSLILQTTQEYGANTKLRRWNESSVDERLRILVDIHSEAEAREVERHHKGTKKSSSIPESLGFQRSVLDAANASKLQRVVARFTIAANSPDLEAFYARLRNQRCQAILAAKQTDFLNALIGFVMSPPVVSETTWEITYDQFASKLRDLTSRYCRDTREFPAKYIDSAAPTDGSDIASYVERAFVRKIHDIEYKDVVVEAVRDYLAASRTVLEEFRSYEVPDEAPRRYAREILAQFKPRYRIALRSMKNVVNDSKTFYDETVAALPPRLMGFEDTPISFRNGILHMQFDDEHSDLKWRLE